MREWLPSVLGETRLLGKTMRVGVSALIWLSRILYCLKRPAFGNSWMNRAPVQYFSMLWCEFVKRAILAYCDALLSFKEVSAVHNMSGMASPEEKVL